MKQPLWFQRLSARERRILVWGGGAAIILLVYALVWMPLDQTVYQQHRKVESQQSLLLFLQRAQQQLQQHPELLQSTSQPIQAHVEDTLNQHKLNAYVKQVSQPNSNTVSLTFKGMPFDYFMQWLQPLLQTSMIRVQTMSVKRTSAMGQVDIKLTLQQS